MQPKPGTLGKAGAALLLMVALLSSVLGPRQVSAQELTVDSGDRSVQGTVSYDLWAMPASLTMPDGATISVWGYATSQAGPASVPGPALIATQGDTINVTLHNGLAVATSLLFEGQALIPDRTGAAPGGQATYSFTAMDPGITLYEAGPVAGAEYQVGMGLYGGLIIRPAMGPGFAYNDAATRFDVEALLVLSELDPALNNAANPAAFDMRNYAAKYTLINGKAFPQTTPVAGATGQTVLLRYVNAGLGVHTMALLGLYQQFLSLAGVQLPHYRTLTSELLGPGQSADALVVLPGPLVPPVFRVYLPIVFRGANALAAPGSPRAPIGADRTASAINAAPTRYALYDSSLLLHNSGARDASGMPLYGGMLTFLTVSADPGTPQGPETSALALQDNGDGTSTLTGVASDLDRGANQIQGAEYFVDVQGADGTGIAMLAVDGAFDEVTENVSAVIDTMALGHGNHPIFVHAQDNAPAPGPYWGSSSFIYLNVDMMGPETYSIQVTPLASDGSVSVAIQATGDDHMMGGSDVVAAEYFIDADPNAPPAPGTGTALAVNTQAPVVSLTGAIPAATMGALAEGAHTLDIRSQDALGNWGALAGVPLGVDQTGPVSSGVSLYPNPNNGQQGVNPITPSVRVSAAFSDLPSGIGGGFQCSIRAAEGFIDTLGADGTGFPFTPLDGLFDFATEDAYAFIPLSTINLLSEGSHPIYVHGQDAAGNWGTAVSANLIIDKTAPTVSNVAVTPNPACGVTAVALSATGNDSASNIAAAEWFEGADPGPGLGNPMTVDAGVPPVTVSVTIDSTGWADGDHTLYVRVKDAAGTWSATGSVVLVVGCGAKR